MFQSSRDFEAALRADAGLNPNFQHEDAAHPEQPPGLAELEAGEADERKAPNTSNVDLTVESVERTLAGHPERAILFHEMRAENSVIAIPIDPIPAKYFATADEFSWSGNLVPNPAAFLWQDVAPEVPFANLISQEARNCVSVCQLYSHYRKSRQVTQKSTGAVKQVQCYEHVAGQIQCKNRYPADDMGIYGILVCKEDSRARIFKMKAHEQEKVVECIAWLKANNIWVHVHATNSEQLTQYLQNDVQPHFADHVQASGEHDVQSSDSVTTKRQALTKVLGKHDAVLALTDLSEYKGQYYHLNIAFTTLRHEIEQLEVSLSDYDVERSNRHESAEVIVQMLEKFTRVSFQDVNLDAKAFTRLFPYGSGSFNSIDDCVDFASWLKSKIHALDDGCRNDRLWTFFQEERKLKLQLHSQNRYFKSRESAQERATSLCQSQSLAPETGTTEANAVETRRRIRKGQRPRPDDAKYGTAGQRAYVQDKFGERVTRRQVDSDVYHRALKQDFMTILQPENCGPPQGMLTFVGSDQTADIKAMLDPSRGPLAPPDPAEHIAHMFSRDTQAATETRRLSAMDHARPYARAVYENPAVVTFSYMRRLKKVHRRAMRRGNYDSLLAVVEHDIKRCEDQQRFSLHHHIPYWCEKCKGPGKCDSFSRYCVQSPNCCLPPELLASQDDLFHKHYHHNYVQAELLRPHAVGHEPRRRPNAAWETMATEADACMFSLMTEEDAFVAYFIRKLQVHWMLHECRLDYCKKNGPCRFFFPFTEVVEEQGYNQDINRMNHIRRHPPDDAFIATHNFECSVFASPADIEHVV